MSNVIATQDLCRSFEVGDSTVHALDHVNLSVDEGELVAVMGPSGSGKSTLLNILGCLDKPNSGNYELVGEAIEEMDDVRLSDLRNRYIGFVFQSFHLLPRLSALENVLLPCRFAQYGIEEKKKRGTELLERLGLSDRITHRPNQLSGGQRQRVAIARALVSRPPLLLADEPTGNLDSKTAEDIIALLVELNREGQTILIVTHEDFVASNAQRVINMRDGKIERESYNS